MTVSINYVGAALPPRRDAVRAIRPNQEMEMKKTPIRVLLALACLTPLIACNSAERDAQASVRSSLKDPDSAKFGTFYYNKDTKKGCLTVNARNSMGGYTGNQQAYVELTSHGWETTAITEIAPEGCREVHADRPSTDNAS